MGESSSPSFLRYDSNWAVFPRRGGDSTRLADLATSGANVSRPAHFPDIRQCQRNHAPKNPSLKPNYGLLGQTLWPCISSWPLSSIIPTRNTIRWDKL